MITRLKLIRQSRGMTQQQLAAKAGVSVRKLQGYECGKRALDKAAAITVLALARAMKCTVEDLIG